MSAVLADNDVDLAWVTFTDDDKERVCDCVHHGEPCDKVAVYKVKWGPDHNADPAHQDKCGSTSVICLRCFTDFSKAEEMVACARCAQSGALKFKKIAYSEFLR